MSKEKWLPVSGWPKYQVSNFGRVKRNALFLGTRKTKTRRYVDLNDCGRRRNVQIARLVLLAFVGPPPKDKPNALHKNDCCWDDRLDNLYWGDDADNIADNLRNGHLPVNEQHHDCKITTANVRRIKKLAALGSKQDDLAVQFGVTQPHISKILSGRSRRHL